MIGQESLARALAAHGVGQVFTMLGGTNVAWLSHGLHSGLFGVIKTRHEETAFNAAVGYARTRGQVGVCTVTRGSGFGNVVGGLLNAVKSRVPVVLVVGESPATKDRTTQNIDQRGLTLAAGAGFHHVTERSDLQEAVHRAMMSAREASCPQVLSVADGLLDEFMTGEEIAERAVTLTRQQPDSASISRAIDVIRAKRRVVILAGEGAVISEARETLEALAELIDADLATTLRANRFFSGSPRDLGLCGGWATPQTRRRIEEADVVIAFGASLNSWTTDRSSLLDGAVVHVDVSPGNLELTRPADVVVAADADAAAAAMITEWRRRGLSARRAEPRPAPSPAVGGPGCLSAKSQQLDCEGLYSFLNDILPKNRVVVTDTGRFVRHVPVCLDSDGARSWLLGRGFGVTGRGLGMAIGAKVAQPDRPVVLICGDGGFAMSLTALDDLRVNGLVVTIVVVNDEQYGSEDKYLRRYGMPPDLIRQSLPDIGALAATFGGRGVTVRTMHDLSQVNIEFDRLQIIDARVTPVEEPVGAVGT